VCPVCVLWHDSLLQTHAQRHSWREARGPGTSLLKGSGNFHSRVLLKLSPGSQSDTIICTSFPLSPAPAPSLHLWCVSLPHHPPSRLNPTSTSCPFSPIFTLTFLTCLSTPVVVGGQHRLSLCVCEFWSAKNVFNGRHISWVTYTILMIALIVEYGDFFSFCYDNSSLQFLYPGQTRQFKWRERFYIFSMAKVLIIFLLWEKK